LIGPTAAFTIPLDDDQRGIRMNRRELLVTAAAAGLLGRRGAAAPQDGAIRRPVPGTGELLPVIGMGTSRTFDVGDDAAARAPLAEVLAAFLAGDGTVIDSSPMYGRAEQVTGDLLRAAGTKGGTFVATKVWTEGREAGIAQMNQSFARLGVARMDLLQVHNLKDWRTQLATLREWKAAGRIRYVGITTSVAAQYAEFEAVMLAELLDFVQLNYSVGEREAEQRLLPLARDKGIATLINRPFMKGALFRRVAGRPLPSWAGPIGCTSWGQVLLKWVVAHPAVTCVIPASAKAANMRDNMAAGRGPLPDEELRQRIAAELAGD
jgi:aryl-alcohol dehydrogenase-like predicted oxidoreductase